ncbi:hypothetical protein SAMN05216553_12561 [Lentzea fradiae]|uniref:Uncharacterized protein n=1 Tax=Lentzea fradiae TaxID=200378 RepID=A0A1G8D0L2_9PSEU|nr:hypothetical protein [Lentzea fradiae]SDH51338.1 hypothetical protein SAMN05216553_12561 [Lentzea fradiae]
MSAKTFQHLAAVPALQDESDDMKIYRFDREASMDWFIDITWTTCSPGTYRADEGVLAA